jgi:hypothetical protein
MNNLPITNKHLFKVIEYSNDEPMIDISNHEVLYCMASSTEYYHQTTHSYVVNNAREGIIIIWDGNVFNFKTNTDIIRSLK